MDRVLAATASLLVERGFGEISVAEIAERAEVSIGSLYARFSDKQTVLRTLEYQMRAGAGANLDAVLGRSTWAGVPLDGFVRGFVALFLKQNRAAEGLLRAFALHAQVDAGYRPTYLEGREQILRSYRNAFVDRIVERSAEVSHPVPSRAARLVFDLLFAHTEQRLFLPATDLDADDLADLVLAYLTSTCSTEANAS